MAPTAPLVVDLDWTHDKRFAVTTAHHAFVVDGASVDGPSPVELLGVALAGCMGIDVSYVLARGRHEVRSLRAHLVAQRADTEPRRFTAVTIAFTIEGAVPQAAADRAVQLSHEKYCSVWHSLRQDIDLQVTCVITP